MSEVNRIGFPLSFSLQICEEPKQVLYTTSKFSGSVDHGSSDCFHGLRFLNRSLQHLLTSMRDSDTMPLAILMANAYGGPTSDGINDVGWAFNGSEMVPWAVSERVDDTSI